MTAPTSPEAITVRRWRCPSCHRSWSTKKRATEHVATCWHDPANRACKTCKHHHPGDPGGYEEPPAPEYCDAGIDMTDPTDDADEPRTIVQIHCPKWQATS